MELGEVSSLVGENLNLFLMAGIGWWVKSMLADIKKINGLETKIDKLGEKVDSFSGELKSMTNIINQNNKEIALLQQSDLTQWKRVDDLSKSIQSLRNK